MTPEPRVPGLRRVFRLGAARQVEGDVEEELRFHLESRVEALVAAGMTPAQARQRAEAEFGSVDEARVEIARIDRRRLGRAGRRDRLAGFWQDVRHAARGLRREPGLALAVVLTLALGIGANAVMFGVVDRLLLSPPPHVRDAASLRRMYFHIQAPFFGDMTVPVTNWATFADLRAARSFEVGAASRPYDVPMGRGLDARNVSIAPASASFFPLLGVRPALGRFFTPDEDRAPAGAPVAVVSHGLWRRALGGDPSVVGRTITLDGAPLTVVGVAPRGFSGADPDPVDVWIPVTWALRRDGGDRYMHDRFTFNLPVYVRLRPGVTAERAAAEATAIVRADHGDAPKGGLPPTTPRDVRLASIIAARASEEMPQAPRGAVNGASEARVALWLLGVAGVVLLVACANVAGLLLGRSVRRRRETAVRLALGVGRGRLVLALLAEGVMLALAGGLGALAIAAWGGAAARARLLPNVEWGSAVDGHVLLATALVALVVGVLCAMAPALQAGRTDLSAALKTTARDGTFRASPLRTGLLVAQSALLVLLLVGAGLFVRSLHNAQAAPLGLDVGRLLLVQPNLAHLPDTAARRRGVWEGSLERVRALPGVEGAALATASPFNFAMASSLTVPGHPAPKRGDPTPLYADVTPDFFRTMGARLVQGRTFAPGEKAVVINETLARRYWPRGGALGTCVTVGDSKTCVPVVGVVRDLRVFEIREEPKEFFYGALEDARNARGLLVRAAGDPAALVPALRRAVQGVEPASVYVDAVPMQTFIDPQLRPWRMGAAVFTAFGGLAFVLAAVGLYGALAYAVAQRRQEIGVRMALGAGPRRLARMVAWEGVRPAAAGLALGVALALALGRFAAPLLFDVAPNDPLVLGLVALALLLVAALASLVPAWRATRVDPAEVLRAE